jgi:flagellar biosynthesis/type III secretory pathway protein FliH
LGQVIKSFECLSPSSDISTMQFELNDISPSRRILTLEEQENMILEKAKTQAEIIVKSAKSEAEGILEKAKADGYLAGFENAASEAKALIERLQSNIDQIAEDRVSAMAALESEIVKLCIEISEKVIRHEIKTSPEVIIRVIKSCLRRVKDSTEVYIRVNPAEIENVRAKREELLSVAEGLRSLNIVDDRRVSNGGCVIESDSGDFDARIETQTEKLKKKIMESLDQ